MALLAAATVLVVAAPAAASPVAARAGARTVRYRGYRLTIPAGWPVFRLTPASHTCVRFNRHAVYLGVPSARQDCPANAIGRTGAVLVAPGARPGDEIAAARAAGAGGVAGSGGAVDAVGLGSSGLVATVTWSDDRAVVSRIIGHRLRASASASASERRPLQTFARRSSAPVARSAEADFTGLGFDACSTPSTAAMAAWLQSPFRAVGVYIGGVNAACAQPNLNSTWVATEVQAGWHLILTYVGYQGGGACGGGCATIVPSQAASEGTLAAEDAVGEAQALGIPVGNPIYDDMEQYTESSTNTPAVLAYLEGWTTELHALGYVSGVYSSASSGITDLVGQTATGYVEPDDIWIADWNNEQTSSDPYVPAADWVNARLHQYRGGHNDDYGGVTINIDSDYLDGATADTSPGASAITDGAFVEVEGTTTVYRVVGDAPLFITSWDPFGGVAQPVTQITQAQFAALQAQPASGTFVETPSGSIYRFAGGVAFAVSSWSVYGGAQPALVVDPWDLGNAGNPLAHIKRVPYNGTVVEGLPSDHYWTFFNGKRDRVAPAQGAVQVDDRGLNAFAQGSLHCTVPAMRGMTLGLARWVLGHGSCALGHLREPRRVPRGHRLRVHGQSVRAHTRQVLHDPVNLWLK